MRPAMAAAAAGAALCAVALALPAAAGATAQTVTVTSLGDPGAGGCTPSECTLREAIALLDDADADADRIEIPLGGAGSPILLASDLPDIDEPLTIVGTGPQQPVISGQNARRVMRITAPAPSVVTLADLTATNGTAASTGGAIMNFAANLTLDHVTVSDSHTTTANDDGGGVYSAGPLTLQSSTITGNFTNGSAAHGGGLEATAGLTVRDSTITGNRTNGSIASGAGIMRSGAGVTVIENSTIADNHAVAASTSGGGAYLSIFPATVRNATIVGTTATNEGGGLYGSGGITLTNSIVSANTAATGPDISAPINGSQLAFDLIGTTAGANSTDTVPGSNQLGLDPLLSPLADNGGPTRTMLPGPTSPALDRGSSEPAADQRGLAREVDLADVPNSPAAGADASDIGAVERQPPPAQPPGTGADFSIGKLIRNKRKGTARLEVTVTAAGRLALSGAGVKAATAEPTGAGTASLPVKVTGKKKRKLRARGSVKVKLSVEFTPANATPSAKTTTGKLKRRRHR